MIERITNYFAKLQAENRTALISYIMAGDPDLAKSASLLAKLPEAGVDIIELGMPFSDPTADGATITAAGLRSLKAKTKLIDVLRMVANFRESNQNTPIILMGYYNPILNYGLEKFANNADAAGVDGLLIVDLPPEEEAPIITYLDKYDIAMIRLVAPTTDDTRLEKILKNAKGFVYTIAIKGITGTGQADLSELNKRINHVKSKTNLPVSVGFGIKTASQITELKDSADGIVVGSAYSG